MNIQTSPVAALYFETPCLVVPIFQNGDLSGTAADLNEKLNGLVAQIIGEDGFKATPGDTRVIYTQNNSAA